MRLRGILDEHSYKNWFSQTRFVSFRDGLLTVSVPSKFFADWLRDHYMDAINESVHEVLPDFREIRFIPSAEGVVSEDGPVADAERAAIAGQLLAARGAGRAAAPHGGGPDLLPAGIPRPGLLLRPAEAPGRSGGPAGVQPA